MDAKVCRDCEQGLEQPQRRRRWRPHVVALIAAVWPWQVGAELSGDEIRELCDRETARPEIGPLAQAIRHAHDNLYQPGTRTLIPVKDRDHDEYIADLHDIIGASSYAWVLDCPAQAKAAGYEFSHNVGPQQQWSVSTGTVGKITLNMDVLQDTHYGPTTYLHEMLHVCQKIGESRTALEVARAAA